MCDLGSKLQPSGFFFFVCPSNDFVLFDVYYCHAVEAGTMGGSKVCCSPSRMIHVKDDLEECISHSCPYAMLEKVKALHTIMIQNLRHGNLRGGKYSVSLYNVKCLENGYHVSLVVRTDFWG